MIRGYDLSSNTDNSLPQGSILKLLSRDNHEQVETTQEIHSSSRQASRHICDGEIFDELYNLYMHPYNPLQQLQQYRF